jgi:hypothetical protein
MMLKKLRGEKMELKEKQQEFSKKLPLDS